MWKSHNVRFGTNKLPVVLFWLLSLMVVLLSWNGKTIIVNAAPDENEVPMLDPAATELLWKGVDNDNAAWIIEGIRQGADINDIGKAGQTPLMKAVLLGYESSVMTLLEHNADVTIGEQDGYTPMHGAGFQGRYRIAQRLIDFGLDPWDVHRDGYTGMHRACWGPQKRHAETVRVFLEAGIPYDLKAEDGRTPMQMTKNPMTISILKQWELNGGNNPKEEDEYASDRILHREL